MLIDAERIPAGQPPGRCDPPGGLCLDGVPDKVPGNAELVGQGGDRGQRVLLWERRSRAARVRAPSDTLGLQQPHGTAETRDVMEPDLPAAVAYRDGAEIGRAHV